MSSMRKRLNTAVLVSGGGSNLQALIDAESGGVIQSVSLSLVISSKADAYAMERARIANIPVFYIGGERFEKELEEKLREFEIELIVLAGFLKILSPEFCLKWEGRIINIHPSLIPAFCGKGFYGLKVHEACLERGCKISGATAHYVNHIPDGGKIILQKAVSVLEDDDAETLQKRIMREAEWQILPKAAEIAAEKLLKECEDGKHS
jgi:phosphoribosylglycinamide formyltransferase-1